MCCSGISLVRFDAHSYSLFIELHIGGAVAIDTYKHSQVDLGLKKDEYSQIAFQLICSNCSIQLYVLCKCSFCWTLGQRVNS